LVDRISRDERLAITSVNPREPKYRKKDGIGNNSQFIDKQLMAMESDADVLLYLDADTTVHGDLSLLFESAEQFGFCATQWNDWWTGPGMARKRVEALLEVEGIPAEAIYGITKSGVNWPSVNGGVWAAKPSSPVLPKWHDWTLACGGLFISDERVLHVMQSEFCPVGRMTTLMDKGRWNSSPIHRSPDIGDEDVVVWHYHGDANVRPDKSGGRGRKAVDIWWPIYWECLRENVGGMADWKDSVLRSPANRSGNKWLGSLEKQMSKIMCG